MKDINLTISATINYDYNDKMIQTDESTLQLFQWNSTAREWVRIGGEVETDDNVLSVRIDNLGTYAIFGIVK